MIDYSLLGQRLFNVPLMLREEKCEVLAMSLLDHFGIAKMERVDATSMGVVEMRQQAAIGSYGRDGERRPYRLIDRVAIVPVMGFLAQRLNWESSWATGYNRIEMKLETAMADEEVGAIVFEHDSGGGEVSNSFDLSRKIAKYSKRGGGKPMIAAINEQSASASYLLSSACDEIYMAETGVAGSIGVWTMLVDFTRALDKDGFNFTIIRAGDRKARGGPYEKADKEIVGKLQAWVEETRQGFAGLVAEHRKARGLTIDDILAQEGDWFSGDEPLTRGLVDGIGSFEAIFERARKLAN